MAVAQAFKATPLPDLQIWYGSVIESTATRIVIFDGFRKAEYVGSFSYSIYGEVFGILSALYEYRGSELLYKVEGIGADANDMFTAIQVLGDFDLAAQIVLAKDDILYGSSGDDYLKSFSGNDVMYGGAGSDVLEGGVGSDYLNGSSGNDTLVGGSGDDRLVGGVGADVLNGGEGFDVADYSSQVVGLTVDLGAPSLNSAIAVGDSFVGIEGIVTGTGNDMLSGDEGANRLSGNLGNDSITGAGGNDTLNGGNGNDILNGGLGDDLLKGGAGFDRILFSGSNAVTINLGLPTAQDSGYGVDTVLDIEAVTSGSGSDMLIGNSLVNALNGGLGDDTIRGGAGNDTVNGAEGNDTLTGGVGDDLIIGGLGSDTAVFAGSSVVVSLLLLGAQNTGAGTDALSGIENLIGSTFADRLTGDDQGNRLEGDAGNDTLSGAAGNDTLSGGGGDDRLGGGRGSDLLEGGLGSDQFVFNTGSGSDFVTDFQNGIDRIVIATGAEGFLDLVLSESGMDTVVSFSDVTVTLAGISQSQINESDFFFV